MFTNRIQNTCWSLSRLVVTLAVFGCMKLSAETPFDALKSKLDQAIAENASTVAADQKVATTGKLYLERLFALKDKFIDQVSLDGVLEVQREIRRMEDSGGIPTEFSQIGQLADYQRIYANEIKKIESEERVGVLHYFNIYDAALLKREEELVRSGFIEKAVDVREERGRVKKVIHRLSQGQVDAMTKKYFASHRGQAARQAKPAEDVFYRPGELATAAPSDEKVEAAGDAANHANEAFDALNAQFKQLLAVHWEMVASDEQKMYQEYMQELRVREYHYQNQGSLDGVLALRAAMKRLEDSGTLSEHDTELKHLAIVQRNFAQDIKRLKSADRERWLVIHRQYFDEMGELERSLVKQQRLDAAVIVRKERERVAEVIQQQLQKKLGLSVFETSQDE